MKVRVGHSHDYAKANVLREQHTVNMGITYRHAAVSNSRYANNTGF